MIFIRFFLLLFLFLSLYIGYGSSRVLSPDDIKGIDFSHFSGVKDYMTLNGTARTVIDNFLAEDEEKYIIRLTPRISNPDGLVAGSAFLKIPFKGNKRGDYAFSTFFRIRITANNIYDGSGIVFAIHADIRKDKALGKRGDSMHSC